MTKHNWCCAVIMATLLALFFTVPGCGKKGDPIPPRDVQKKQAPPQAAGVMKDKEILK
jgi:predicted small lipoprotein YifL